jgi:hypothetical protein
LHWRLTICTLTHGALAFYDMKNVLNGQKEHRRRHGEQERRSRRSALQRFLTDIENAAVDVVVVYKIERLSRSLMDFPSLCRCSTANPSRSCP